MEALSSADISSFEGFRFDRRAGVLFRRDQQGVFAPIAIGRRAIDLLGALVERPGDLVSRDKIIDAVWPGTTVEDSNLNVQIAALRRILDDGRAEGSCIQTVSGRGYRFVGPVTWAEPAVPPMSSPISGNGSGGHIAEDEEPQGPGAPGPSDGTPLLRKSRARHRLWAIVIVAIIGALGLVAAVVLWNWHLPRSWEARPAPRMSIVVLPFANLNNDPEQQYFADAVTEDLTTDLSRISNSFVISRNTAFTYKDKPVDAKQIGRELGVRYVLEGSVRRSGNQVRVNVQLIDAETNAHLWAERFDRDMGDLFALQSEITSRIAIALNSATVGAEAAHPTANPDALDYSLRARAVQSKPPTRDSTAEAIGLFERALALDPKSDEAQVRLALALTGRVLLGVSNTAAADLARAESLLGQISPDAALAHMGKGQLLRAQRQFADAIPEYEAAIALNRNLPNVYATLGRTKLVTGSLEEVVPLAQQAIRLSPRDPNLGFWYNLIGLTDLLQARTDEAIVWFEKARSANPAHPFTRSYLAAAYGLKGESERAAAELAEARRLSADPDEYSSIAHMRALGNSMAPKVRALFETTVFAGLRKAGMPEE